MKLNFADPKLGQADPYIFKDNGKYYIYCTGGEGAAAFSADSIDGVWNFEGFVCKVEGRTAYWAPCIFKYEDMYYLYFSCEEEEAERNFKQRLYVAKSDSPLGPFTEPKMLYDRFTIDPHVVQTDAGIFIWYAEDNIKPEWIGSRIFVDKLLDPYTPANICKEVLVPTFKEEMFRANRLGDGRDWYTLEGPFWFSEGDKQYVMFSGACFENDTYHINYAMADASEQDPTKAEFVKNSDNGKFSPLLIKNEVEEGTGHHSVIKEDGQYYVIYHGRDYTPGSIRTARKAKLNIDADGKLTIERI